MKYIIAILILLFCSCDEYYLAGSYVFVIENNSLHDVVLRMEHNYPDDFKNREEILDYMLTPVLKPGEVVYYSKNVLGDELDKDLSTDNVTPIWDEYYIKEIIVNDTILSEDKWRREDCWSKNTNWSDLVKYTLTIK